MIRVAEFTGAISGILTIIGLLWRIAWTTGKLVQRFGDHVESSDRLHADQENRIRTLENRARRYR